MPVTTRNLSNVQGCATIQETKRQFNIYCGRGFADSVMDIEETQNTKP
ncbi:hypothetical protein KR50_35330 [Jeotgalibacillus campisalis]|uniref:Uncharacterized protein n=1 Tax=Jeotgalibacillus campisalis TaxID=220754 RepID=A0A0C2QYM2_9BACL|nr:hypothetical protein KR50_35330 [Jeotgalibacillus campisalis]